MKEKALAAAAASARTLKRRRKAGMGGKPIAKAIKKQRTPTTITINTTDTIDHLDIAGQKATGSEQRPR